jgi:hypothetical protein
MAISTAVNSVLLTFGPHIVIFKGFNVQGHKGGIRLMLTAFFLSLVIFIAKYSVLGLLSPLIENNEGGQVGGWKGMQEFLKCIINTIFDVAGLLYLFSSKDILRGESAKLKCITVAVGWSAFDLLARYLPDIIYEQGPASSMKLTYLYLSAYANFEFAEVIGMAFICEGLQRRRAAKVLSWTLLCLRYIVPLVF